MCEKYCNSWWISTTGKEFSDLVFGPMILFDTSIVFTQNQAPVNVDLIETKNCSISMDNLKVIFDNSYFGLAQPIVVNLNEVAMWQEALSHLDVGIIDE